MKIRIEKCFVKILSMFLAAVFCIQAMPITFINAATTDIASTGNDSSNFETDISLEDVQIEFECIERREEYVKHYKLSNGTYIAVQYNYPVHTLTEDGNWIDIDNEFHAVENYDECEHIDYQQDNGLFSTLAVMDDDGVSITLFDTAENEMSLLFPGYTINSNSEEQSNESMMTSKSESETEDNAQDTDIYTNNTELIEAPMTSKGISLENISSSYDIQFAATTYGLNERITVEEPLDKYEFANLIEFGELTAFVEENGNISVKNNEELVYTINAPYLYDSNNEYYDFVSWSLSQNDDGENILALVIDDSINDSVNFPITITSTLVPFFENSSNISSVNISSNVSEPTIFNPVVSKIGKNSEENIHREFITIEDLPSLYATDVFLSANLNTQIFNSNIDENISSGIVGHIFSSAVDDQTLVWENQPSVDEYILESNILNCENLASAIEIDITKYACSYYEGTQADGIMLRSDNENDIKETQILLSGTAPYIWVNYISVDVNDTKDSSSKSEEPDNSEPTDDSFSQNISGNWENVGSVIIGEEDIASVKSEETLNAVANSVEENAETSVASSTKVFNKISTQSNEISIQYCVGETWYALTDSTSVSQMDGVRIHTENKPYYFLYKARNGVEGWLKAVPSTSSAEYAGSPGYAMTNISIEVYEGATRVFDNYVVMYRAKVAGEWLEWVSNGIPDVMKTIQQEHGLSGNLDTSSTNAGWASKGSIQALEIRMFERAGYTGNLSSSNEFQSLNNLTQKYCVDNANNWNTLTSSISVDHMDGIRLTTTGDDFYLKYKTRNVSKGWLDPVLSTSETDYAGWYGFPVTNISIEVYEHDIRVFDNYVVMYRAKVADEWLEWVSNGEPEIMYSIKAQFGLAGALDTVSTNAGWASKGNIQALDIRLYKRTGYINNYIATEDFLTVDALTQTYLLNSQWNSLTSNTTVDHMDGVRLLTNSDEFYLKYKTRNTGKDWLSPVLSTSSSDYAGWSGYPITNLSIEVYDAYNNTRLYDSYVVMYRAKVAGDWLEWVSNGEPEIMYSIKMQFDLDGALDTSSTNSGWASRGNIQALDIRLYKRDGILITPGSDAIFVENADNIDYYNQISLGLPNGCEATSTSMLLSYYDINISPQNFVTNYLERGNIPSSSAPGNPNKVFVGNPALKSGWGCYAPVIINSLNKIDNEDGIDNFTATKLSALTESDFCNYLDNDTPVLVWAKVRMTPVQKYRDWVANDGVSVHYNCKLHCLLLIGYDNDNFYFHDPLERAYVGYSKEKFMSAYNELENQAIIIEVTNEVSSGNNTVIENIVKDEPEEIEIEDTTNNNPDNTVADPIDLARGSHIIDHKVMSILGAQPINLNISYSSDSVFLGDFGIGWTSNFAKRLDILEDGVIKAYDNEAYYAVYNESSAGVYVTNTITKNNYTITKTADAYILNCNNNSTEYYDLTGKLIKIRNKSGFETLIQYPTADSIKIIDSISGRYLILTKNSDGRVISVSDNEVSNNTARTCYFEYLNNCLIKITDENGNKTSYRYTDNKQIETGTDSKGTVFFRDFYDDEGKIIEQTDGSSQGRQTIINYDKVSEEGITKVTVTDRNGNDTVYRYNSSKQLLSKTDANNVTVTYEYDASGNLTKKTDGRGYSDIVVYDNRNNVISATDKNGNTTTYTYDDNNNLLTINYPNGSSVVNTYDTSNRLRTSTDVKGIVTTYEYDTNNFLVKTICSERVTEYTYVNGQVASVKDPLGRVITNTYNDKGFLISSTDAKNKTTYSTYDQKGNILTVTDAQGNILSKEYDSNGMLIKSTDANGNSTYYTYDGNLNMTSMTLPTGDTIQYEYDGEEKLVKTIYPDGKFILNEYDSVGRLIKQTNKNGNTVSYEYDAADNIIKTTNAIGGVTIKEYDPSGKVKKTTVYQEHHDPYEYDDPYTTESVTTYEYDSMGNLIKGINALGGITTYTYNVSGNLLTVTDALGNVTSNTYDEFGNLLSVTDPKGNVTQYTYDKLDNLLTVTNALGQVTTNTYDATNKLLTTTDPGGHTTTYGYDELGRLTSKTDARGNTVNQYYDANGNIVKITDESGYVDFEATYDDGGRAVTVTDSSGSITYNQYDYSGNMIQQTDALNNSRTYTYDGEGNMISAVDALGGISYATYDGMGNITSVTGPEGSITEYEYDSYGQLISKSGILGDEEKFAYNAIGLKVFHMQASWAETEYTYDAAGRITSFFDGFDTARYTYDANGNVLTASDGTGTVTREYDALNRVTKYTDIYGKVIEYEYDVCGNLTEMVYPNGEYGTFTYDANHNMLSSSPEESEYATTYVYNAQNQVIRVNNPDGGYITKAYDSAGRLQVVNDRKDDGTLLLAYIYTYDALGRMITETEAVSLVQYTMTYDNMSRLVKRTKKNCATGAIYEEETFVYDGAGNITSDSKSDGSVNTYVYEDNNNITTYNGISLNTDYNGNTTSYILNGSKVYADYDVRNRLKKINGHYNEYWYDVENNRINMFYYSTNMMYSYDTSDGRNRLVWTMDHNYDETTYYYGAEGLIWSRCDDEYRIYHYDYRGSVVAVTDIDGNVTDTISYDSYGKVSSRTGTSNLIFGYNGRDGVLSDPNGLLYMRARYYSPDLKRFMNCDILDGSIADSSTLNLYAYVNGNPISYVDPFGLCRDEGQEISGITYDDVSFGIHTVLDVAGMIPVYGMIADGVNALYYLFEGDWGNAALSALAFIPAIGEFAGAGKITTKGVKIAGNAYDAIKYSDEAVAIATHGDDFVGLSKAIKGKDKPTQIHHFATDKNKTYTKIFKEYTDKYNLKLDDDWNKEALPHQGRHPNAYHQFVLDKIEEIDAIANGDQSIFIDLFEKNVKEVIRENPDMLYSKYWKTLK